MKYMDVTEDQGKAFYLEFHKKGKIVMLNMLKYKSTADYSIDEDLNPGGEVSGKTAYSLYMKATLPLLSKAGGRVIFFGKSSNFVIGPLDEKWDAILLVEHASLEAFMKFAQDPEYLKIVGHRTAALDDSRLLPSTQLG